MNENEIGSIYLDEAFVKKINNCDLERLSSVLNYMLENYKDEVNSEYLNKMNKAVSSLLTSESDSNNFSRQLKYLINWAVYSRISKKFKNDLLALNFENRAIELICSSVREYLEEINNQNKINDLKNNSFIIKDFEIKTEMPIIQTKYEIKNNSDKNEDLKKQKLLLKLNIQQNNPTEYQSLVLEMDKNKLISFNEEIEKIQEKLDKLY